MKETVRFIEIEGKEKKREHVAAARARRHRSCRRVLAPSPPLFNGVRPPSVPFRRFTPALDHRYRRSTGL